MDKYFYEARDKSGKIISGFIEADSLESAEEILRFNQLSVITVKPHITLDQKVLSFFRGGKEKVKSKQKAVFARQIATMVNAGLPLMESLRYLYRQTPDKNMKGIIDQIIKMIEKGRTFSFALAQFPEVFSPIFTSMVRSGEASGKLDKVLNDLADQLEGNYSIQSKIKGALYYPAVIMVVVIGVAIYSLTSIIPQLKDVFLDSGAQLPLMTNVLIAMSNALMNYWYVILIVLVLAIIVVRYFLSTEIGRVYYSRAMLVLPIFKSVNKGVYISGFARTLGLLVGGGVPIIKSLYMVSDSIDNVLIKRELKMATAAVEKGIPLSEPLSKSSYFPPLVASMIAVGEQTGDLDKILFEIAKIYEQDSENLIKGLTSLVEPVIMIMVGIAAIILILAVVMPIYQLTNSFI